MNLLKFADIRRGKDSSDRVGQIMLIIYIMLFLVFLVLPLGGLIFKSLQINKESLLVYQTTTYIFFRNQLYSNRYLIVYLLQSPPPSLL